MDKTTKVMICPYCGATQPAGDVCRACAGHLDATSRQATHNAMGPWWIRDERRPFQPGCSYETLVRLVERGRVTKYTILRGPTTRQFWTVARRVPGVAHLLGCCHQCDASVDAGDHGCHACGVAFGAYLDRNFLGVPEVQPLPWEDDADRPSARLAGGAPAPLRPAWPGASGPPEARTLSSFASDEELTGRLERPEAPAAPPPPPEPASAPPAELAFGATPRALQRRIAHQERVMRVLTILLVAALALLTISQWSKVAGLVGGSPAEMDPASGPIEREHEPNAGDLEANSPNIADVAGPVEAEPEARPATPAPAPVATDPLAALRAQLAEARDAERPAADRMQRLEAVVEALEARAPGSPAEAEEIAELLRSTREELERLRLREFFE